MFQWTPVQFSRVSAQAGVLVAHFHEYLLRGGFPQPAMVESIQLSQKLLREDIVDKVLKRDMTALFGVRRVLELEQTFLYLCLHDGGVLDIQELCKNLEVKKPTAMSFIDLLEHTHLIYRLRPFGYGKEVLRGRHKVYLADPAIAPSVLLKGKTLLEDAAGLGRAVETAFFKHVFARYYAQSIGFSFWRGRKDQDVDIIADVAGRIVPFEVKYRGQKTGAGELEGLREFCRQRRRNRGLRHHPRRERLRSFRPPGGRREGESREDSGTARVLLARQVRDTRIQTRREPAMIPSVLASQVRRGIEELLLTTFPGTTPFFARPRRDRLFAARSSR